MLTCYFSSTPLMYPSIYIFRQITALLFIFSSPCSFLTRSLSPISLEFCALFVCLIRNISLVQLVLPVSVSTLRSKEVKLPSLLRSLQLPSHLSKQLLSLPLLYRLYQQAVSSNNRNKSEGRLKLRYRERERKEEREEGVKGRRSTGWLTNRGSLQSAGGGRRRAKRRGEFDVGSQAQSPLIPTPLISAENLCSLFQYSCRPPVKPLWARSDNWAAVEVWAKRESSGVVGFTKGIRGREGVFA